ncbi:MAG TPA: RluA family pseudouridine synthase [Myxococcota bacterium]
MRRYAFRAELDGQRLDQAVSVNVPDMSRRHARELIGRGSVFVDGVRIRLLAHLVPAGAKVEVVDEPLPQRSRDVAAPATLFDDGDLLVVDKPAGLATEPTRQAATSVVDHFVSQGRKLAAVHRLDVDTSGVLVLASPAALPAWSAVFRDQTVERVYVAIVAGHVVDDEGLIDAALAPPDRDGRAKVVKADHPHGKPARTAWQVLARSSSSSSSGDDVVAPATLVALRPQTGRTHQLRVHMAHVGHALIGDRRYSTPVAGVTHLGLHALVLGAVVAGTAHRFVAPIPEAFAAAAAHVGLDLAAIDPLLKAR